jgi:DNA processing protein
MVAIVGTREASGPGATLTRKLAAQLAEAGIAIMSGGAKGIDTAAHLGALDAGGTTAVMAPSGFDNPYPEENSELFRRIVAAGGAHIALVESELAATRAAFFARNACMVALSHAVIVTESPVRSGANNAAKWSRKLGRMLFVVPHSPWHSRGAGCVELLRLGGQPIHTAKPVLHWLEEQRLHAVPPSSGRRALYGSDQLEPEQLPLALDSVEPFVKVLSAVRAGARHADEVAARTGLQVAVVQEGILTLLLSGDLARDSLGSLQIVNRRID